MVPRVPVSEIASLIMKEGVDIFDKSSSAYKVWQDCITTITKVEGYRCLRYGYTFEKPSVVDFVIDWESIESHKKFQASPEYGPFSEHLEQIMISAKLYHFHPQPSPPSVLDSAPVTEMAVFFGTDDNFNDNVGRFLAAISEAEGSCGFSHGEIIEDLAKTEYEKPGKAVQLCIGWQSKQLHMRFRESDVFKKNIHLLRKGMSGVEMHHTAFTSL